MSAQEGLSRGDGRRHRCATIAFCVRQGDVLLAGGQAEPQGVLPVPDGPYANTFTAYVTGTTCLKPDGARRTLSPQTQHSAR